MNKNDLPIKIITVMLILLGLVIGVLAGFGTVQSERDNRQDIRIDKNTEKTVEILTVVVRIDERQKAIADKLQVKSKD